MRQLTTLLAVVALAALTGCSSNLTCDDPQIYQSAREGQRIVAPDGLDKLEESKEVAIPKASPRDPRPAGSPCLELPPTVSANDDDE